MLFAQETQLGIGWLLGLLAGAGGVIAYLFRMLFVAHKEKYDLLLVEKDRVIKESEEAKNSLKEIANEAVKSYLATANHYRKEKGEPPIVPLAPVVSESHSPPTRKQREDAEIATLRAKMAAINLETGIKPRKEEPLEEATISLGDVVLATKGDVVRMEEKIAEVPEKVVEKLEESEEK